MRKIIFVILVIFAGVLVTACESDGVDDPRIVDANNIGGRNDIAVNSIFRYTLASGTLPSEVTAETYFLVQAPKADISGPANSESVDPTICDPANKIAASLSPVFRTVLLTPSNPLSENALYAICFLPEDFQGDFTTAGETPVTNVNVTGFSKTSVTTATDGDGAIAITFTLDGELSETGAPVLTVDNEAVAGDCTVAEGRLSITCPVTALDGCTTFTDYTAILSGTGIAESDENIVAFNSADDEFDSALTLTNECWVAAGDGGATISDNKLNFSVPTGKFYVDAKYASGNISILTYLSDLNKPSSGTFSANQFLFMNAGGAYPNEVHTLFGYSDRSGLDGTGTSVRTAELTVSVGVPTVDGSLSAIRDATPPVYVCMVIKDNTIKSYFSSDGVTFISADINNYECLFDCEDVSTITNAGITGLNVAGYTSQNYDGDYVFSSSYGYFRVKSSGITGESSADCPTLTAD